MTDLDAVGDQRFLEGKRAADGEAHQVVAPDRADIAGFLDQVAVPPDPIAGHIGTDIQIRAQRRQVGTARLGHADDRARLRVAQTEAQEIIRQGTGQDGQIGLHMARGEVGGGRGQLATAGLQTHSKAVWDGGRVHMSARKGMNADHKREIGKIG